MHSSFCNLRLTVTIATAAILAGCGGGSNTAAPQSGLGRQAVPLSIVIPSASSAASSSTRRAQFISVLTQSITVNAFPAGSQAPSSPQTVANVGPGQPGCSTTTGSSGTLCTVSAQAPTGSDTFVVSAFTGTGGGGSLLSQSTFNLTVTAGMSPVSVSLTAAGASVSGDMLGYSPSRAWSYTVTSGYAGYGFNPFPGYTGGGPWTGGLYADPSQTNGLTTLVGFAASSGGNPFLGGGMTGDLVVQQTSSGYVVSGFGSVSNGSFGYITGQPLLVQSSLQLGTSWNPLAGTTTIAGITAVATVIAVGSVPGMSACPNNPSAGATVQYTATTPNGFLPSQTNTATVSYVPGCGITDFVTETGAEFKLTNVGTQNLGNLSVQRNTLSTTWMNTLRTLWQQLFVRH